MIHDTAQAYGIYIQKQKRSQKILWYIKIQEDGKDKTEIILIENKDFIATDEIFDGKQGFIINSTK